MLRGHRSYLNLFNEPATETLTQVAEKRGRNEAHIQKRNALLLHRHYFYYKIKGVQYHIGLKNLEDEFFITERTIVDIVQTNTETLKVLKGISPDAKYFKRKYPFMNWE